MEGLRRLTSQAPEAIVRAAFWLVLIAAVTWALLPQPPSLPIDAFGDKWEHGLTFVTLAVLAALGYRDMPLPRIAERLSFLGALIEVFQSIPALHRDCDFRDWLADTIATVLTLVLLYWSGMIRREHA